ncbi:MAG: hypothetical protein K2I52_03365, partial [Muribaculaceae bacterium]|nr:hypothetical protein [Muribaculaceae bacterium]
FVDMGLSVKWGAHEIGAADYMSAGTYYAFGTIENANNYEAAVLGSYPVNSNGIAVTSVVRDPQNPAKPYDVATEILGSDWHTPNLDEWNELLDNTDISKEKVNGVTVHRLKSKINGNSILFTAHGYMRETSSSPQMSTSVILQTSNAPTNNIYTTINIVNPSVKNLARQTFWLVPIRPVMKNRSSGIDDVLSDNESDAPYNVFDLTGRCVAGQVSLQEGKLRLSHGVYIFVGRTGKRFKIAL